LKAYCKISLLLLILLGCSVKNINAQDTLSVAHAVKSVSKKDPLRATMLALAFPGMGQIYNKKYWKVPLVYAGLEGLFMQFIITLQIIILLLKPIRISLIRYRKQIHTGLLLKMPILQHTTPYCTPILMIHQMPNGTGKEC